jgi:uncharacterized membrane protein YtjA (UPF0391 family)
MPFLIPVLVAGGLGFGGGFLASEGFSKLLKLATVAGVGYLIIQQVKK